MLKEKLQADQKEALKSGDSQRRTTIGMVLAAIKNKEIEKRGELSEDEMLAVVASEVKKRKEAAAEYEKGGRPELAAGERKEIETLSAYLPEQMSEAEVRAEVKKTIRELGALNIKDMGKVIGAVMAKLKARADGQMVSAIVKSELGA